MDDEWDFDAAIADEEEFNDFEATLDAGFNPFGIEDEPEAEPPSAAPASSTATSSASPAAITLPLQGVAFFYCA